MGADIRRDGSQPSVGWKGSVVTTETGSTRTDLGVPTPEPGDREPAWAPSLADGAPPMAGGPADGSAGVRPASRAGGMAGILVAAVVAVVAVGAVVAVWTTGNGSDTLEIPSSAPATLLGQGAAPHSLAQNPDWSSAASEIAQSSTASFASIYGSYPPPRTPTTATFLVVAGQVRGGNQDIPSLMHQEVSGVTSSFSGRRDAEVEVGRLHASVLGGQTQCVSAREGRTIVGECLWLNAQSLVQLVTFTDHLPTVDAMTTRIVDELHAGRFS